MANFSRCAIRDVAHLINIVCCHLFVCLKLESPEEDLQSNKRQKTLKDVLNEGRNNSSYHPTMGHVVAICHARIPFIQLREEVNM